MALFQIAEPGESAAPHEHKLAIGIDLGTTNSLVATVRSGISVVLNDEQVPVAEKIFSIFERMARPRSATTRRPGRRSTPRTPSFPSSASWDAG